VLRRPELSIAPEDADYSGTDPFRLQYVCGRSLPVELPIPTTRFSRWSRINLHSGLRVTRVTIQRARGRCGPCSSGGLSSFVAALNRTARSVCREVGSRFPEEPQACRGDGRVQTAATNATGAGLDPAKDRPLADPSGVGHRRATAKAARTSCSVGLRAAIDFRWSSM